MSEKIGGFLGGRLQLAQPARGHRVGMDAALLAAAAPCQAVGTVLDAGAGVGAIGLCAAVRAQRAEVGLIEIAPTVAEIARRNVMLNGMDTRVRVYEADLLSPAARRAAGLLDEAAAFVLTNPPFHTAGRVRVSPNADRALAHVAAAPLADWTRACLALLAPGGGFAMIHRADALGECLAALEGRLGALRILPIAPRMGEAAGRIVVAGVKGSKAPSSLLAPLVLHEADGAFTPLAAAIFRGEAALDSLSPLAERREVARVRS